MVSRLSTPARAGLVAVALVAAVALGAAYLVKPATPAVGGPSASAPPTVAPSASPTVVPSAVGGSVPIKQAAPAACFEGGPPTGCIVPGTYLLDPDVPGNVQVTLPAGWFPYQPGAGAAGLLVDSGPDAPGGSGWGVVMFGVGEVRRDPCDPAAGAFEAEEVDTPGELAAALGTWPDFAATAPTPITLDGASGVQVDVVVDQVIRSCPAPVTFVTPLTTEIDGYPMIDAGQGLAGRFLIVDVNGELLVLRVQEPLGEASPHEISQGVAPDPDRHTGAHERELAAILDSIRLTELEPAP